MAENSGAERKRGPGRPFPAGVSPNPGGRPRQVRELLELAREACPAAIELARKFVDDETMEPRVRLDAAKFIASYGLGRPPSLEAEEGDGVKVPKLSPEVAAKLAALELLGE